MESNKRFSRGLRESSDFTESQGCKTEVCAIQKSQRRVKATLLKFFSFPSLGERDPKD